MRLEGVNFEGAEEAVAEADARTRPLVEGLAGYQGHLHLVSRGGDALAITFFDSEANASAAEQVFDEEIPRKLDDVFQRWEGRRAAAGLYEVFVDSRS